MHSIQNPEPNATNNSKEYAIESRYANVLSIYFWQVGTLISPIIFMKNKLDYMSKIAEGSKSTNNISERGPNPLVLFQTQKDST